MSDHDEIICLDSPQFSQRRNSTNKDSDTYRDVLLSLDEDDPKEVILKTRTAIRKKIKSPRRARQQEELLSLSSDSDNDTTFVAKNVSKKRVKKKEKSPVKVKLPKTNLYKAVATAQHKDNCSAGVGNHDSTSRSRSSSQTPKKKTLADIVTNIHDTSTDEMDSDEVTLMQEQRRTNPSFQILSSERRKVAEEPQPCSSKAMQQYQKTKAVNLVTNLISSDEDLPDIDEFFGHGWQGMADKNLNEVKSSSSSQMISSQSTASSVSSTATFGSSQSTDRSSKKTSKKVEAEAERKRKKEAQQLEKDATKAEELRAKELRKVTRDLQRSSKPGESIKHMTVILDSAIADRFDALVPQLVVAEIKYELEAGPIVDNCIKFQREILHQAMEDNLQIKVVSKFQDEDQILILIDSDRAIPMIYSQLKKGSSTLDDSCIDFATWVESMKSICQVKKLTLVLYDFEKYFRKLKKNTQQEFRNRVLNADDIPQPNKRKQKPELPEITQTELQSVLIQLQLQTGINYRMIKNVSELASLIIQYTKAIADAPYKKQRIESQGFDWFALSDATGSVKVDKDGLGLRKLWEDQLRQFSGVGADIATAIANQYNSPQSLIQRYNLCNNIQEGQLLLKDLSVTTGFGPLARTRKVGPEASKKVYTFFTSTNGDRFLGSTMDSR